MSQPRETKWTPGPWHFSAYKGGWDCVLEEGGAAICRLVLNEPANALLIAAAPEQNAALQAAPPIPAGFWEWTGEQRINWLADYMDWYDGVRAGALRRANGETE